jgi:hypothetical protein
MFYICHLVEINAAFVEIITVFYSDWFFLVYKLAVLIE